jgi:L-asparaginase
MAFSGGDAGILAMVDADGVHRLSTSARGAYYAASTLPNSLPRVDLVKLVAGSDGLHVRASVGAGALGVVLETFGSGNATEAVLEAVRDATSRGVVVVVTSRTGSGRVRALYGDNGGGVDLARAGAVFASDLTGSRARIALALALSLERFADVRLAVQSMAEGKTPCEL